MGFDFELMMKVVLEFRRERLGWIGWLRRLRGDEGDVGGFVEVLLCIGCGF